MTDERYQKIMADLGMPHSRSLLQALQQVANEVTQETLAAERERWAKRVEEAFYEGFTSPVTYNDTLQNSADEAWAKAKTSLLKA